MKKQITITIPDIEDCAFKVECLPEDMQIKGNASAIDEETDKAIEQEINRQLGNGNPWAWCTVKVTCYFDNGLDGIEGVDYLGGCSYKDKADFVQGGYFEDMKAQAYDDFLSKVESLAR